MSAGPDLTTVLNNATSSDASIRQQAESILNNASNDQAQYSSFIIALCQEFTTDSKPENTRQLAGLYLKNMITSKTNELLDIQLSKWENWVSNDIKQGVKSCFLHALNSPLQVIRRTAAQNCAAYGIVEVRQKRWPELITTTYNYVINGDIAIGTKVAALESLGYLCEEIDVDDIEAHDVDRILSAIINGMKVDNPNEMRLAATKALNNSLIFCDKIFERDEERHQIMTQICQATRSPDLKTRVEAFRCINTVAEHYYNRLPEYVSTLFQLTSDAVKNDDPFVGTTSLELWCVICERERDILEYNVGAGDNDKMPFYAFMSASVAQVLPILLESMTKQQEDDDVDWGIAQASATCLKLLSQTVGDPVIDIVMPFIQAHIGSPDWHYKEAALMAFGSILDGPSENRLKPYITQAMGHLLTAFQDTNVQVKSTSAWTIGVICELNFEGTLTEEMVIPLLTTISTALDDENMIVATQGCYVIERFAIACEGMKENPTNPLSAFMQVLVTKLFTIVTKQGWESNTVRTIALETMGSLVSSSAADVQPLVAGIMNEVCNRLLVLMQQGLQQQEQQDIQTSLCSVLVNCISRLNPEALLGTTDAIMSILYAVFQSANASAQIEAFIATSNLIAKINPPFADNPNQVPNFLKYMQHGFCNFILNGLRSEHDHEVCSHSIGLVEDLCIALGNNIRPYTDDIMKCLLDLLASNVVDRSVKPKVFSAFSEIANAILNDFEVYFGVMDTLAGAASSCPFNFRDDDEDLIYIKLDLKTSILNAYNCILLALYSKKEALFQPHHIQNMLVLVKEAGSQMYQDDLKDTEFQRNALMLFRDLLKSYGAILQPFLMDPDFANLVSFTINSNDDDDLQNAAKEVSSMIRSLK